MNRRKKKINPVNIIIIVTTSLILVVILMYWKNNRDQSVRIKASRDSINASRQYYLDSILNYRVDTAEYQAGEIKKEY